MQILSYCMQSKNSSNNCTVAQNRCLDSVATGLCTSMSPGPATTHEQGSTPAPEIEFGPGVDIVDCAVRVLQEPDPWQKAQLTRAIVHAWRAGEISIPQTAAAVCPAPDRPARADDKVRLVPPSQAPKLGKGGSLASRQAIVHSLCHIESWAIDLSWDAIARWGRDPRFQPHLPRQFYDDFVMVADDECRHFLALESRLKQLGSHYGAIPAHDGLWESASTTAHNLAARLAVEHCVHEARGLDVLPFTIAKFRNNGDDETAGLLEGVIYPEEVQHCAAGIRWLKHLHSIAVGTDQQAGDGDAQDVGTDTTHTWRQEAAQFTTVQEWFHHLVRSFFHGHLKPPLTHLPEHKQALMNPGTCHCQHTDLTAILPGIEPSSHAAVDDRAPLLDCASAVLLR